MTNERILQIARAEQVFSAAAIVPTSEIPFDSGFRVYCEENLCGNYGANYTCPPDCGSPEELRRRILAHAHALVLQSKWDIPDYRDADAIRRAKTAHNAAMLRVISRLRAGGHCGQMAGASNCLLCERCAKLEDEPCRHPEDAYCCMSAYCIHVRSLSERCGMDYACPDGHLAFFGLYAF